MRKVIWTLWLQGRDAAPELVRRCLDSWERKNAGWELRCLDQHTVGTYIPLLSYVDLERQSITAASLSDIIRILLLHEYGGVWVDATTFCNRALDDWLPAKLEWGFFAFAAPGPDRPLSSWFLAARSNDPIIAAWLTRTVTYWKERSHADEYFWFHYLFRDLIETEAEFAANWALIPKISADGPHQIQHIGLSQPADRVLDQIDWSIPVFKLTYRLNEGDGEYGTILAYLLGAPLQHTPPTAQRTGETHHSPPSFCSLKVSTENIGDHIQIIASDALLARFGIAPKWRVDRDDEINSARVLDAVKCSVPIILNGWFKRNTNEWPPSQRFQPLFIGFHIRLFQCPNLVSPESVAYYERFAPIGCRDQYTQNLLRSHGVEAYLSHCLSLSLPKRCSLPTQTKTFVVSRDTRLLEMLPADRGPYEDVCHYTGSSDFEANLTRAASLLDTYRNEAGLIITSLLHCALPAIAMGIPVIVFFPPNDEHGHGSDRERFSSLSSLLHVYGLDELDVVDWRPKPIDVGAIKLHQRDLVETFLRSLDISPTVSISNVAPSHTLPVPESIQIEKRMNRQPDRKRWSAPGNYRRDWSERAHLAASLIGDGARVFEIGAGIGNFRMLVENRCDYVGADLEPLAVDIIKLNIDSEPLPENGFDVVVALGVIEYLFDPRSALSRLCDGGCKVVVSYCFSKSTSSHARLAPIRSERGWVNDLSREEIMSCFASSGLQLVTIIPYNSTSDFEQEIMLFQRI